MCRTVLIPALLLSVSLSTAMQAQQLSDSAVNELKKGIEAFKERFHSPSIAVAIVNEKDIIFRYASGYTDVENKIAATVHSRYPILSVSKTFTATMYMQLAERNKLGLHDELRKYIPEYAADSPSMRGTTLFQLATHTSGLPRNSPADIHFARQIDSWHMYRIKIESIEPPTTQQLLRSLKHVRIEYPEYELLNYSERHYSNLGYSLLGIACERASGTSYEAYVKQDILRALGMNSSGFDSEDELKYPLAQGYYYNDSTRTHEKTPRFISHSAIYAGGMYSSANDLATYICFLFNQSAAGDKILSRESRNMMYSFRIGWKPNYPIVFHEGAMLGYRCVVAFHPGLKIGWVVLTNTTDIDFNGINSFFSKLLFPQYSKESGRDLKSFAGTYKLEGGYDSLKITLINGQLYSTYLGEAPLTPAGGNNFKCQAKGTFKIHYEFLEDAEGNIKILNLGQMMWVKQ